MAINKITFKKSNATVKINEPLFRGGQYTIAALDGVEEPFKAEDYYVALTTPYADSPADQIEAEAVRLLAFSPKGVATLSLATDRMEEYFKECDALHPFSSVPVQIFVFEAADNIEPDAVSLNHATVVARGMAYVEYAPYDGEFACISDTTRWEEIVGIVEREIPKILNTSVVTDVEKRENRIVSIFVSRCDPASTGRLPTDTSKLPYLTISPNSTYIRELAYRTVAINGIDGDKHVISSTFAPVAQTDLWEWKEDEWKWQQVDNKAMLWIVKEVGVVTDRPISLRNYALLDDGTYAVLEPFVFDVITRDGVGIDSIDFFRMYLDDPTYEEHIVTDAIVELRAKYTDNSIHPIEFRVPLLRGERGEKGEQGPAGTNGKDGRDGKDGTDGANGFNGNSCSAYASGGDGVLRLEITNTNGATGESTTDTIVVPVGGISDAELNEKAVRIDQVQNMEYENRAIACDNIDAVRAELVWEEDDPEVPKAVLKLPRNGVEMANEVSTVIVDRDMVVRGIARADDMSATNMIAENLYCYGEMQLDAVINFNNIVNFSENATVNFNNIFSPYIYCSSVFEGNWIIGSKILTPINGGNDGYYPLSDILLSLRESIENNDPLDSAEELLYKPVAEMTGEEKSEVIQYLLNVVRDLRDAIKAIEPMGASTMSMRRKPTEAKQ